MCVSLRSLLPAALVCGAVFYWGALHGRAEEGVVLKYDDGTMESKRSIAGGGHAVLFKRPEQGEWYLDQVQLFGARYGYDRPPTEDFFIYVTDETMEKSCKIPKPYSLFEKGEEQWTTIKIPPVKVPESFYVCFVFNPTQTKGVYVGIDENVKESHSKQTVPGSHVDNLAKTGDWMIRAHLSAKARGKTVLQLAGKDDRDKQRQADAAGRDAQLLKGATATLLKHDNGTMDKYQSYGGQGAQTVMFEAPEGDRYVYGISFYGSQYGGQHDAEAVLGDVYLLDAELRVLSRTSFPYSLLTYQKDWIEVPTLLTRVKGKFYVAIHAHSEQSKGIYIGYNENVEPSHSKLGVVNPEQFTLKNPSKKLEWMIRVKMADRPVYYGAEK